jgi:polysaccharide export outer membrane protein
MPFRFAVAALTILVILGCGGASGQYDSSFSRLVESEVDATALGPGDVFEVRVFREKELSGTFQVAPDGTVDFPLIGSIRVDGLNSSEVSARIRDGLANGYLREPFVTVTVTEFQSKRVYVLGQVAKPGTFRYEEGMTVIQAVTLAGGFTKTARPNSVVVTRNQGGKEVRIEVPVADISRGTARNLALRPGDIVFVPESIL